jgi:anti-anti-sigma factor
MEIKTNMNGKEAVVQISGRLDTTNYNEFETISGEWFNNQVSHLILDCSDLNYISSSGLRVFLTIQKRMMASGGKFSLFAMQPGIREIFDISGFSSIFSIFPDIESARKG